VQERLASSDRMAPEPSTPSKKDAPDLFDTKLSFLNSEWDLGITPKDNYSPSKTGGSLSGQCVQRIRFLHHKKALDPALRRFREQALVLYTGWVNKPKGERGVVPAATRNKPKPVTERERVQLLRLLLGILKEDMEKWMSEHSPSPSTRFSSSQNVDDRPVKISLTPKQDSDPKRPRTEETFPDAPVIFKKPRKPEAPQPQLQPPLSTSKVSDSFVSVSKAARSFASGSMAPPDTRPSANTSFASDASSIFSRRPSFNSSWQPSTQETVPEDEDELVPHTEAVRESFMNPQPDKASSTDYGTSSFEERMANVTEEELGIRAESPEAAGDPVEGEELSQDLSGMVFGINDTLLDSEKEFQDSLSDAEKEFQDSLRQIFCKYSNFEARQTRSSNSS